jgi:hypothetical protein
MPLHTFLGMAQLCLDLCSKSAQSLDSVLIENRIIPPNIYTTEENNDQLNRLTELEQKLAAVKGQMDSASETYNSKTKLKKKGNSKVLAYTIINPLDNLMKQIHHLEQQIENTFQSLKQVPGYFLRQFNAFILGIKVVRKSSFGHSLVGSEAHDLFQPTNIAAISALYKTQLIPNQTNQPFSIGDDPFSIWISQFMTKLSTLYRVYTATRKLTEEEIKQIHSTTQRLKIILFNAPMNPFPYTPKLHNLIFHFPNFAEKYKTIGLFSEQGIESIHIRFKSYDTKYVNIVDQEKQLLYCVKQHNLSADCRLNSNNF